MLGTSRKLERNESVNYSLGNSFFRNGFDFFDRNNKEIEYLRTDIYEQDDAYYLKVEIPGVDKNNLELGYENGYLTIAVKQEKNYEEVEEYIRKERMTSEMQRTFYIGDIKEESIKANYENGILTVRLDKKEEVKETKRQITIE